MLEASVMNHQRGEANSLREIMVSVRGLKKYFPIRGGMLSTQRQTVRAVDGVDIEISRGETLGLVGESGSGKTTLGRLILRLEGATEGAIFFEGKDIRVFSGEGLKDFRRNVQIIFQDPYSSLNPRQSAGAIIGEPFKVHGLFDKESRKKHVERLMDVVGLTREQYDRYPHEFSGGQRQRIGIARAIALNPRLIIADEPVSALDVSIQAQILNLLRDLQKTYDLTYLFISHDLSVIEHVSDRIAVMYLGRIVELAGCETLQDDPCHPYTRALLSAVPAFRPEEKKERIILKGDISSPVNPPAGCSFHPRCPFRMKVCETIRPELREEIKDHRVACHLYGKGI